MLKSYSQVKVLSRDIKVKVHFLIAGLGFTSHRCFPSYKSLNCLSSFTWNWCVTWWWCHGFSASCELVCLWALTLHSCLWYAGQFEDELQAPEAHWQSRSDAHGLHSAPVFPLFRRCALPGGLHCLEVWAGLNAPLLHTQISRTFGTRILGHGPGRTWG